MARTALRTKLYEGLADRLTDIVVDAVLTIQKEGQPLDLYMVRGRARWACCARCDALRRAVGGAAAAAAEARC